MQLRLIQGEQMATAVHRLPLGSLQGRQFGLRCRVGLASRSQSGTRPAPTGLVEQASNAGAGQDQVEPCGQKSGQQAHRPAGLNLARARWGLTGLGIYDRPGQRFLGRSSATGLILQPGHALALIPMQPGAHDILSTGIDQRNLGNGEAAIGEQDHLSPQGHTPDRLMAEIGQFVPLCLRQGHVDHPSSPRLSEVAEIVPHI